jgi:hypothetical protein
VGSFETKMNIHSVYALFQRRFRVKRMRRFEARFSGMQIRRVLDIGGTAAIWHYTRPDLHITLLNRQGGVSTSGDQPAFDFVSGDALSLPFPDDHFDLAFSNSVIEHVGGCREQQQFSREALRVAPHLWVQTPARWFPVEPHFVSLGIHYLPKSIQPALVKWLSVWGWLEHPGAERCRQEVEGIRLLTKKEMVRLFPDCQIITERCCLLPKSYIAVR